MNKSIDPDQSLIGKTLKEIESLVISLGTEKFRGMQLFDWLYSKQVDDYDQMSNLPAILREKLANISIHPLKLLNKNISNSKQTQKYLFALENGNMIESVIMMDGKRTTVCLSTQVGCAVDCDFCATAKMGFVQNLTVGEIVDQFLQLQKISCQRITNVVFMGMGEPFLNYEHTIRAAHLLHHPKGINMGAWRITISTSGITRKINQFAKEGHPYKLAVSLNASNEKQRLRTMPITKAYPFLDLINASRQYTISSRKKITFEYVMIANINDDPQDAIVLIDLLGSINCKLNIIPYNEIEGPYKRPNNRRVDNFLNILENAPFSVTVRWSKGQGIDAGCGQLATKAG
ncbi:MAG: 23S rRNA (adenine(2503)-C(2))-methyltransferase RlmN [Candidatus Neomarinimicrobiota bacterium]